MEALEIMDSYKSLRGGSLERTKNFNSVKLNDLVFELVTNGFKAVLSLFTAFLLETINLIYVGRIGNHEQTAGVGLGSSVISMVCITFGIGVLGATDTLVSNSFGDFEYYLCGVILNRS